MIVFDFHNTLSLKSGKFNSFYVPKFLKQLEKGKIPDVEIGINDMKSILKKYKKDDDSWYETIKKSKIDAKTLMPAIDNIIYFIDSIQSKGFIFAVASMLEDENFIHDLLYYCFEQKGRISAFNLKTIVSTYGLKETNIKSNDRNDKWPHIEVIMKRNNLSFSKENIIIIDDDINIIKYMSSIGVNGIYISTIKDWTDYTKNYGRLVVTNSFSNK